MLGMRTASLIALDIEHIDIEAGLALVHEKGSKTRLLVIPDTLVQVLEVYLNRLKRQSGPLFLSARKRRISARTLQDIFQSVAKDLGFDRPLHARLFRHTAATLLNKTAGTTYPSRPRPCPKKQHPALYPSQPGYLCPLHAASSLHAGGTVMKKILAAFQKELLDVAGLAESTVQTYLSSVVVFSEFAHKTCNITALDAAGHHLLDWFGSIKGGISASRLRQHQFAIKKFFSFLEKRGMIDKNPAKALTRLGEKSGEKNTAVSADTVFTLLAAVEQTSWLDEAATRQTPSRKLLLQIVTSWFLLIKPSRQSNEGFAGPINSHPQEVTMNCTIPTIRNSTGITGSI